MLEWLFLAILVVPIAYTVWAGMTKWLEASARPSEADESGSGRVEMEVARLTRTPSSGQSAEYELHLRNVGTAPAHSVRVFVGNRPASPVGSEEPGKPPPVSEFESGEERFFRVPPQEGGSPGSRARRSDRDRALVRLEWEGPSGQQVEETVVEVR